MSKSVYEQKATESQSKGGESTEDEQGEANSELRIL